MSPNTIGALLMIASMACFTLNDTLVKLTGGEVPLFQLIFLRGVLTTALILVTKGRLGPMHFNISRRDWNIIAVRSLAEIASAYFFLTALFNMPLGNVTAILQVLPLSVTLASALVLREAVAWRRMVAIGIGFFWGDVDYQAGGRWVQHLVDLCADCGCVCHCARFGNAAVVQGGAVDDGNACHSRVDYPRIRPCVA